MSDESETAAFITAIAIALVFGPLSCVGCEFSEERGYRVRCMQECGQTMKTVVDTSGTNAHDYTCICIPLTPEKK